VETSSRFAGLSFFGKEEESLDIQLVAGVDLHIIPTKQFKVTRILVDFAAPQAMASPSARNLVANLLVTSSAKYRTQTVLARHLTSLYGASLSGYVSRVGLAHTVRVKLSLINDQVAKTGLFERGSALLKELLFNPLVDEAGFDQETYRLQQANTIGTLQSWDDDKRFYALRRLQQAYYQMGAELKRPASGTIDEVRALTRDVVYQAYQRMLTYDKVNIVVVGDVDPAAVTEAMRALDFQPRTNPFQESLLYHQASRPAPVVEVEHQLLAQAKLDLAYHLPAYYHQENHVTAIVLNGLLGGTPYSMLFTNVREKASLAYYASSSLRPFTGQILVETGINPVDQERARKLIEQQVADLAAGKFSDAQFQRVKEGLVNQYVTGLDNPNVLAQARLTTALMGIELSTGVEEKLRSVTRQDVCQLANQMNLEAVFLLDARRN
jgi:predicted Zn-dependent peptidase